MNGKVIALLQKKGGATKTTTAINLLGVFLEAGYKAKLCDMDKEKPDALLWADFGTDLIDHVIPLYDDNPTAKIEELKKTNHYIFIDTPPNFEAAALKAAMLCDLAIIPTSVSELDKNALQQAAGCALMAKKQYKFLASRTTKKTIGTKSLLDELAGVESSFKVNITNSVAMTDCQKLGTWVGGYLKNGVNHEQYKELLKEILNIFGGANE